MIYAFNITFIIQNCLKWKAFLYNIKEYVFFSSLESLRPRTKNLCRFVFKQVKVDAKDIFE